MRYQRVGTDGQCTCCLNRIHQLQPASGAKSSRTFRDFRIQVNDKPRFERSPVPLCEGFIVSAQRSGQHLGEGYRGNRKPHPPFVVCLKYRLEYPGESGVILEHMDDWSRVNQEKRTLRQPFEAYRFHSSLTLPRVARLS